MIKAVEEITNMTMSYREAQESYNIPRKNGKIYFNNYNCQCCNVSEHYIKILVFKYFLYYEYVFEIVFFLTQSNFKSIFTLQLLIE